MDRTTAPAATMATGGSGATGGCAVCASVSTAICYEMRAPDDEISRRCLRHALLYRPMLHRSLVVALLVGTLLTAINQGNIIVGGDLPGSLFWKVPLTYCVPFAVATTGAILNARSRRSDGREAL